VKFSLIGSRCYELQRKHGRPQGGGGKTGIPPLGIEPRNENFLENMKSVAHFRIIDFILAMTVYLPVIHSTLHKSHVQGTGVMQLGACSSLISAPLRGRTWERIFLLLVFIT